MSTQNTDAGTDRRRFLGKAAVAGVGVLAGAGAVEALTPAFSSAKSSKPTSGDVAIVSAAEIAEALAVTTYTNIIDKAPFFKGLPSDDQGYLKAARQEEMSHYLLEKGVTGKPSAFSTFYYPPNMFSDTQTTLNVLVTLEDAFIAAYLVGVRNFSTADLRVLAARIMGIESDHRTLARVVADDAHLKTVTGVQGKAENVAPPNNNGYERTLEWTNINQAVTALTPFADKTAAGKAGFDTSKPYQFKPFTPKLPDPLGAFHSFAG